MKSTFYIVLNMKRGDSFEPFAKYFIGADRAFSCRLFAMLEGDSSVKESDILHLDLMETVNGLPVNINVISCTLEQLTANCRAITKEIFKARTLEEME